jgi:predicted RNA-binding Zn-ribbon protein involved in translation (DUF1610 family)
MEDDMEGLFAAGGLLWIMMFIICLCIAIAPLIIWRNTNRTNRLLAIIAIKAGADIEEVRSVLNGGRVQFAPKASEKFCPACGAMRPATERVCKFCGHESAIAPRKIVCPDCGQDITHMPSECPKCGKRFTYKTK